jgi:transposase-like protein
MKKIDTDALLKWDLRVKEVESNGYSVSEYCRSNGISERQYYYWANRIKESFSNNNKSVSKSESFSEVVFREESNTSSALSIYFNDSLRLVPDKCFCETEFLRVVKLLSTC